MNPKNRLAAKLFKINLVLIIFLTLIMTVITAHHENQDTKEQIDQNIRELALIMSEEPLVREVFFTGSADEQTMTFLDEIIKNDKSVDYIVLADNHSIRLYHPDHSMIGESFQGGDEGPALEGAPMYITDGKGSQENQRRCFVSIINESGDVLGFIMVSRYSIIVEKLISEQSREFGLLFLFSVLIAAIIAFIPGRIIRKQLLGYEPSQIARMFLQREEILDGLTEGIMLINDRGECEYVNEAAASIFGSRDVSATLSFVETYIKEYVLSETEVQQETIRLGERTLLMDIIPIWNDTLYAGSLVVISDKSESIKMAAQLTGVDQIIGALRASTHETNNRMHVILGLLQIGEVDEAIEFIQSAAGYDEEAEHIREHIQNNTLAALLIGKRNRARELDIDLKVRKDSYLGEKSRFLDSSELVTIIGNLLENSIDAIVEKNEIVREISLYINETEEMLVITVDDTGIGMTKDQIDRLVQGRFTTKGENHGIGIGLVKSILKGYDGILDIESEPGEGTSISITIRNKEV